MAIVRKFTIGVMPFAKMFRIFGTAGAATDAVLKLRGKGLADDYFTDIGTSADRSAYQLTGTGEGNVLKMSEESIVFTKDYYESGSFDFAKVLQEFRLIWKALDSVLAVADIRRIGLVVEYRYDVGQAEVSDWIRTHLLSVPTIGTTEKALIRFEERDLPKDGGRHDVKTSDFVNRIVSIYDSAADADRPEHGFVDMDIDVQRYFRPVLNSNVPDEVLKLHRTLAQTSERFDGFMKSLGGTHVKKQQTSRP